MSGNNESERDNVSQQWGWAVQSQPAMRVSGAKSASNEGDRAKSASNEGDRAKSASNEGGWGWAKSASNAGELRKICSSAHRGIWLDIISTTLNRRGVNSILIDIFIIRVITMIEKFIWIILQNAEFKTWVKSCRCYYRVVYLGLGSFLTLAARPSRHQRDLSQHYSSVAISVFCRKLSSQMSILSNIM